MGFGKWLILKGLEIKTDEEKAETEDCLYSMGISSDKYKIEVCDLGDEEVEEKLTEKLKEILKGFLNRLQEEYSTLNSDEAIKDHIIMNEFEFEKNGERF